MATTALSTLKSDIANVWNKRWGGILGSYNMPRTATASGSTTSITDLALGRGTMAVNDFNHVGVENITNATFCAVDNAGLTVATGVLATSPAVTTTAQNDVFILWPPEVDFTQIEDGVDLVLENTEAPFLHFPSLFVDSNIENTTETINFTAISGATLGRNTTADNTFLGEASLGVTTNATGEGVKTGGSAADSVMRVTEREQVLISTFVKTATAGGAISVVLYDATAGEAIKTVDGIDEQAWTEVRFQETVPDNCELLELRWTSDAATAAEFFIAAPIIIQSLYKRWYIAPPWLDRSTQIKEAWYLRQAFSSEQADTYLGFASALVAAPTPTLLETPRALNEAWLLELGQHSRPYAIMAYRPFDALSSNTSTTRCDRDYIKWKVIANECKARGEPWREFDRIAQGHARRRHYGEDSKEGRESGTVVLFP